MTPLEKKLDEMATIYGRRSVKLAAALRSCSTVLDIYGLANAGNAMAGHAAKRMQEEVQRAVDLLDEIDREDREAIARNSISDMPDRTVVPLRPRLIPMGRVSDGSAA
jgi:L-asparaginase II